MLGRRAVRAASERTGVKIKPGARSKIARGAGLFCRWAAAPRCACLHTRRPHVPLFFRWTCQQIRARRRVRHQTLGQTDRFHPGPGRNDRLPPKHAVHRALRHPPAAQAGRGKAHVSHLVEFRLHGAGAQHTNPHSAPRPGAAPRPPPQTVGAHRPWRRSRKRAAVQAERLPRTLHSGCTPDPWPPDPGETAS